MVIQAADLGIELRFNAGDEDERRLEVVAGVGEEELQYLSCRPGIVEEGLQFAQRQGMRRGTGGLPR